MSLSQTYNEQTKAGAPAILELLSELEQRDIASKGLVHFTNEEMVEATDPRDFTVINPTGNDVGKVEDLYVDPNTRQPFFALLALGNGILGIGDRHVLVGFDDIEVTADKQVRVKVAV
jgi:sporulation protein YlmC with PRC-barrel domain